MSNQVPAELRELKNERKVYFAIILTITASPYLETSSYNLPVKAKPCGLCLICSVVINYSSEGRQISAAREGVSV